MNRRTLAWLAGMLAVVTAGPAASQAPGSIERGRYLMQTVVACGNCHAARGPKGEILADKGLSGGMVFDEQPFKAHAPNITPDNDTGIGKWTDAQLARAIREGIRPDGSVIGPPMPIEFYRHIADDDLKAIVAYLRSQPAVKNAVPRSEYRVPLPPNYGPPVASVTAPPKANKVKYGEYLANIGHCMECHTPRSGKGELVKAEWGAGGQVFKGPWGASVSRNLTPHPTGLKGWSDAAVAKAIRTGVDPKGNPYRPPMAFEFYKGISDEDMGALVAYLRSLAPKAFAGKTK